MSIVHLKQRDGKGGGVTRSLCGFVNAHLTVDFVEVIGQTTWGIVNF